MNMKKYHQIYYLKISSNLLFENIIGGGGGAGEGAVGARRRWSWGGCGGSASAVERGVLGGEGDLARGDSDRDGGGSRSSVLMNIQYFFILNMKKYHQI